MLESFVGTFDLGGLRTLKRELHSSTHCMQEPNSNAFWAIIDVDELPEVLTAYSMGQRKSALEIVIAKARSLGRIPGG